MWTRDQLYTVLTLRNKNTLFSKLPIEIIQTISDFGQDPDSILATALNYAADARQESVKSLLALLEDNPRLLLQAGNVTNRGGNQYKRVTLYEFLLGEGDDKLVMKVGEYFSKIEDGEQQRMRQYERYQPHIKGMLTQKPYDLSPLVELIKKATPKEIKTLLKRDMTDVNTELCQALLQFRKDWAPQVFHKPCMHYNYASLKHALDLFVNEWENLYQTSGNDFDKITLVWRQLIGFEMRRLPGIDRCIVSQGLHYVMEVQDPLLRSYLFRESIEEFPINDCDDSVDGLGGDFAIDIIYGYKITDVPGPDTGWHSWLLDDLCQTKTSALETHAATANSQQEGCVIF